MSFQIELNRLPCIKKEVVAWYAGGVKDDELGFTRRYERPRRVLDVSSRFLKRDAPYLSSVKTPVGVNQAARSDKFL